ncbi:EF-hand domain-containing protein 1-like isoform X2 [Leptopilina boulardi]|uniref:EF-hand domain-containing protein 1-like isoform X2 n=1 Tax=Leptopilina boulardi TaxID=63433 RepID=UPI0021F526F1|nr:EF-hand domain-containing protein 1-like isoform X2 [Leptopilina boulardi]XP_051162840.1 EF-hand domain-containing protein 1-like isoform X2 [Leptopilina boulardi]
MLELVQNQLMLFPVHMQLKTTPYDPSLTYGRVQFYPYRQFVPHYTLYSQKCLSFKGFFRQKVFGSQNEHFRIRYVNIIYYLENDTLSIIEPKIDNAGFNQGTLVRRGKITRNNNKGFYHWKHLNVGIDLEIYGVIYHTYDCDKFTKEFMTSQGIDIGDKEEPPIDPYILNRSNQLKAAAAASSSSFTRISEIENDPRRRFFHYDGMVLLFDALYEDDFYQILYFLTDNTISVREIHRPNDGKDPVTVFLKKTRVPKNWKDVPGSYPGMSLERGDYEIVEYYSPNDLKIGETISIFERQFFLFDCDNFTRKYYSEMLGIIQSSRIEPPSLKNRKSLNYKLSSHNYVPLKKNTIRQILNFPQKLRYSMKMDAVHPEDETRIFILEYNLSNGKIQINECCKPNSGRKGGIFLSARQIQKPNANIDDNNYYGPEDFYIGAKINAFNHYFIITGADLFVYRYIEENLEKFSENLKNNMRNYFLQLKLIESDVKKIEDNKNFDLEPFRGEIDKNSYEMENCLKTSENQVEDQENVFLKSSMPICDNLNQTEDQFRDEKNNRELRWSDKIEINEKNPIVDSPKENLGKEKIINEPDYYFSDRNKKFQMGQLNYEEATEPLKLKFPAPQEKFVKTPNFNNISLVRETYKAPKVS